MFFFISHFKKILIFLFVNTLLVDGAKQEPIEASFTIKEDQQENVRFASLNEFSVSSGKYELFNQQLKYNSSDGDVITDDVSFVSVDEDSGDLMLTEKFDREASCGKSTKCLIKLLINQNTRSYLVDIFIDDVNDNKPYFPICKDHKHKCDVTVDVPESLEVGKRIKINQLLATDDDIESNLKYTLSTDRNFEVVFEEGNLYLKLLQELDYEFRSKMSLHLQAEDSGRKASPWVTVNINVININDNKPQFEQNLYDVTLTEQQQIGDVITTVRATDGDSPPFDDVTYYLSADNDVIAHQLVAIDEKSGDVIVKSHVDWLKHDKLKIIINARNGDDDVMIGKTILKISVIDSNNNNPEIELNFKTGEFVVSNENKLYIPEEMRKDYCFALIEIFDGDQGRNAEVDVMITSRDDDVIGDLSDVFQVTDLQTNQKFLKTTRKLDRETQSRYHVIIKACDRGEEQRCSEKSLDVELLDVNDHDPIFEDHDSLVVISEDVDVDTEVFAVRARDDDVLNGPAFMEDPTRNEMVSSTNGIVSYMLVNSNGDFRIDSKSGKIFVNRTLDRESVSNYKLTVRARDGGIPVAREAVTTVNVKIDDVNDNVPEFHFENDDKDEVFASVLSDDVILVMKKVDGDEGKNGETEMRLLNNPTNDQNETIFLFDEKSGKLRLNFKFPNLHNQLRQYFLLFEIQDKGSPVLSSKRSVPVTIVDFKIGKFINNDLNTETNYLQIVLMTSSFVVLILIIAGFAYFKYTRTAKIGDIEADESPEAEKYELMKLNNSIKQNDEWKSDNSRYDELKEAVPKRSFSKSAVTSHHQTGSNKTSLLSRQPETDSGRGDSSPDAVSPIDPMYEAVVTSRGEFEESLGPCCSQVCLTEGHSDGCWINLNPGIKPESNKLLSPTNYPTPSPHHSSSLYVDLYPPNLTPNSNYITYEHTSPVPSNQIDSRNFYPYPTTTMTSIYSSVVAPETRHYETDAYSTYARLPSSGRPSSALPHQHNRIPVNHSTTSRRYNTPSRIDDVTSCVSYNAPYDRVTPRFRRSASTDAILHQNEPVTSQKRVENDEVSIRETREIVANIEKLLAHK